MSASQRGVATVLDPDYQGFEVLDAIGMGEGD
jgi:hypothetical protein